MIILFYDLLYMLPLCLLGITLGDLYFDMPKAGFGMWLLTIVVSVLVSLFFHSKNKLKFLYAGLFVMAIASLVFTKSADKRMDFIYSNLWFAELCGLAIGCELAGLVTKRYKWARGIVAIDFITLAAVFLANEWEIHRTSVAMMFLQTMVYIADLIQEKWMKTGDTEPKKHLVCVAPFLLAISLLVSIMPAKQEPYDWKFAIVLWERATEAAKTISSLFPGKGSGNEYAEVGFDEDSNISGSIHESDSKVLEITVNDIAGNAVYVAGKTFDTFAGLSWTSSNSVEEIDRIFDIVETRSAIKNYDRLYANDFIRGASVSIKYLKSNMKYLFVPSKAVVFGGTLDDVKYAEYSDALRGTKKFGYGVEYRVSFDRFNLDQDKFDEMMENLSSIPEDIWKETLRNTTDRQYEGADYSDFLTYRERVYSSYTENIEISAELRKVLDEVYGDAQNDWEKLKRLEDWLSGFNYSETPGSIPKEVDTAPEFLDYFLLESKCGYCVHFATAFTLLARAEGLPARFVQGFYVKERGTITVTEDMAHSWPEVYIDNFGWMSFEPTPGYKVRNYWKTSEEYISISDMVRPEYHGNDDASENAEEETGEEPKARFPVKILLAVLGLCIGFAIIFLISYYFYIKKKLKVLTEKNLAVICCKANLFILGLQGFKKNADETLEEYKNRIAKDFSEDEHLLNFIDEYEKLIYSLNADEKECLRNVRESEAKLITRLKEQGRMKFFLRKISISLRFANIVSDIKQGNDL